MVSNLYTKALRPSRIVSCAAFDKLFLFRLNVIVDLKVFSDTSKAVWWTTRAETTDFTSTYCFCGFVWLKDIGYVLTFAYISNAKLPSTASKGCFENELPLTPRITDEHFAKAAETHPNLIWTPGIMDFAIRCVPTNLFIHSDTSPLIPGPLGHSTKMLLLLFLFFGRHLPLELSSGLNGFSSFSVS